MDSFFGVGGPELLLVLVLALVALGPLRMLQAARSLGRLLRDLRRYYNDLMAGINQELSGLDRAPEDLRKRTVALPPKPDRPDPAVPDPATPTAGPDASADPAPADPDAH
jgi:Sec-independent protein translocase protein TatA